MRISKTMLLEKAKNYEDLLKDQGFNVNIRPYFAYGAYSFYFNFNPTNIEVTRADGYTDHMKQVRTKMGTTKEVWKDLDRIYWMVLARHERYKWEHVE